MNKKCYRVIFSKTLQRLVVVSEISKSETKSSANSPENRGSLFANFRQNLTACRLTPLTFSLFCALGFVAFSESALAETLIIKADSTAPKNQQPIILQTANGIPQVNIQTPNNKGLSHNKYHDFNVDTQGAILNNSRTNTQTQQAGFVQGNPYLARGEASVILNEVTTNNPSQMKGYVEVAGKKAEVVIANPNGIHCEGCGVVNANRATFTTGKPQLKDGSLDTFVVEKGKISIAGKGLDSGQTDYTDIIAKEAQINAGVWAKRKINVVTGKQTVKRAESDENLQIIHQNQPLVGEQTGSAEPQFAVDVGELGGMYAGKIHLIGTEQGLGVRNAGHIGASSDSVVIDSQGRVVNGGTINAANSITTQTVETIDNTGRIEAKGHSVTLTAGKQIKQNGAIIARGGDVKAKAQGTIQQQGETIAKGHIHYQAKTRTLDEQQANGKQLHLTATEGGVTAQGKNIASGEVKLSGAEIDVNHSQTSGYVIDATARTGDIQVNHATLNAQSALKLNTTKTLVTQHSRLRAQKIETTQQDLNTEHAVWEQTGMEDLHLAGKAINNRAGTFKTQGNLTVKADVVDNREGTFHSAKQLELNTTERLRSSDGKLIGKESVTIASGGLDNKRGLIYSQGNVQIDSHGDFHNNQNGTVQAGKNVQIFANGINNSQDGLIYTDKGDIALELNGQSINNTQGKIRSGQDLNMASGTIQNQNGLLFAQHDTQLNAKNSVISNSENGQIINGNNLTLNAKQLDNQAGRMQAGNGAQLNLARVLNNKVTDTGSLIQAHNLTFNSQQIDNNGTVASTNTSINQGIVAQQLELNTERLYNQQGGVYTQQSGIFNISQTLNNQQGEILGWGDLQILAKNQPLAVNNSEGKIQAKQALNIDTHSLTSDGHLEADNINIHLKSDFNTQRDILAYSRLAFNTTGTLTNHHQLSANQQVTLNANRLDNAETGKISAAQTRLNVQNQLHNQGLINSYADKDTGSETVIKAANILNEGIGRIYGDHVALQAEKIENRDAVSASGKIVAATIAARQRLDLVGKEIINSSQHADSNTKGGALIFSSGDLVLGAKLNEQERRF